VIRNYFTGESTAIEVGATLEFMSVLVMMKWLLRLLFFCFLSACRWAEYIKQNISVNYVQILISFLEGVEHHQATSCLSVII